MSRVPVALSTLGPWARYAAPEACFDLAGRLQPHFWWGAALLALTGAALGLVTAPDQFAQGDAYRIVFLHVPAAWMSLVIYLSMGLWAAVGLALSTRVSFMMARALAPTGAMMTVIALWSGALWGKPTSGEWWVWDAQLSAELLLLFLYLGFILLQATIDDPVRSDRAGALLAVVGSVQVPVVWFALQWWGTRQRGIAAAVGSLPPMAAWTVAGLAAMVGAFWAWSIAASLHRMRSIILERGLDVRLARTHPEGA